MGVIIPNFNLHTGSPRSIYNVQYKWWRRNKLKLVLRHMCSTSRTLIVEREIINQKYTFIEKPTQEKRNKKNTDYINKQRQTNVTQVWNTYQYIFLNQSTQPELKWNCSTFLDLDLIAVRSFVFSYSNLLSIKCFKDLPNDSCHHYLLLRTTSSNTTPFISQCLIIFVKK